MADSVQWLSQSDYSFFISRILLKVDSNTELPWAVDVMMARAKTIFILIIKVNELLSFYVELFSKTNRKHVLRFYRFLGTLVEVWENSKKLK